MSCSLQPCDLQSLLRHDNLDPPYPACSYCLLLAGSHGQVQPCEMYHQQSLQKMLMEEYKPCPLMSRLRSMPTFPPWPEQQCEGMWNLEGRHGKLGEKIAGWCWYEGLPETPPPKAIWAAAAAFLGPVLCGLRSQFAGSCACVAAHLSPTGTLLSYNLLHRICVMSGRSLQSKYGEAENSP